MTSHPAWPRPEGADPQLSAMLGPLLDDLTEHEAKLTLTKFEHVLDPELLELIQSTPSGRAIWTKCVEIARFLMEKNRAYGDSARNPRRIFSSADPAEQIRVRLDDKLSRLAARPGSADPMGEDVILDLIGYLVLLLIVQADMEEGQDA